MKRRNPLSEKAVERFQEGYNCAQSVLLTMFQHWNIGESDLVPKIATGFGGGIGRCGSVCGALTGGVMAVGVKYGTNEPLLDERLKSYELAQKLYKQFEKHHGSVYCRELIEYDLSNPKELEAAQEANVFRKKCDDLVRKTVETLVKLSKQ
ncbi:C_GCAxxG_C_C family protein [Candidatus Bathyarchaeota archaeon]|nr:C_GCAxxG_C_C family protein [Candidatus Bathyarchaeota archaeon]